MEETSSSSSSVASAPKKRTHPILLLLVAIVPVAIIGWILYVTQIRKPFESGIEERNAIASEMLGLSDVTPLRLDVKFTDADGDLVADPPTDAKQLVDPPTLTFSFVGSLEPEVYQRQFREFVDHLSAKVGKPVQYALYKTPEEELAAMADGKLHVAGFNTGNVPLAVSRFGFVPVCNFATADGVSTYRMELIVPADGAIRDVKDIKGRELTLTQPGSNAGFKVPLVLMKENELLPVRDFTVRYSLGYEQSITGIANKTYQVAAVASDVLARELAAGNIKKEQYRTIHQSENFPTAGLGYVYNLKPEVAAKVKEAFFSFEWKGTGLEREFGGGNQAKFVPVSFKKDWEPVRRVDDEIRSTKALSPTTREAESERNTAPTTSTARAPVR